MVNSVFREHESSSHLSRGNIMIKSPSSRPLSPLTQNESVFGVGTTTTKRGGGVIKSARDRTHSLDNNSSDEEERQQPSLASISSRNKGEMICDYDRSVTHLYEMLESSDWEGACDRCRTHPNEVHTWVARRDINGDIRWKLLPLHAAVIFKAPLPVIECLLKEHPIAAAKRDDQGMLPLHLAFRHKSAESVIEKLLHQYPGSVIIKDQRKRLPLDHTKDMTFSPMMMTLYAETYNKCQYHENEAIANEAEMEAAYENRMDALKDAYEVRIVELIKTHEETVESIKIEAEEDTKITRTHHNQEIDQLRSIISREVSSGRRASQLETKFEGLNNSLVEEKREKEALQMVVQDQKIQKDNLIDEIGQILINQKALHDQCDKQQEQLVQAQKLREQLLRTLLQKEDGKAVQVSSEIYQLSSNTLARTEKLLNDASRNNNAIAPGVDPPTNNTEDADADVVPSNNHLEDPPSRNPATTAAWSAADDDRNDNHGDDNDNHGDDISAITDSSYIQPFGDS
jgi:hypothetical protein